MGQLCRWEEENFGKRIWVKVRCYWEHHLGTDWELEELSEEYPWNLRTSLKTYGNRMGTWYKYKNLKIPSPHHALVSICIEHYLCNLHPSYQSVSSAFAVFLISVVLVELCLSPGFLFIYPYRADLASKQIFQFMVQLNTGWFTTMLKNVETLGGQAKTLSNLGILKIKLTFWLWGFSNFNIHSLLCKGKGSLSTTQNTYCKRRGRRISHRK